MDFHNTFTEWAAAQGVEPNGIAMHRFAGRGNGIIAERPFEAGDIILTIPISAVHTADTVPQSIRTAVGSLSVQGLLAAEVCMDNSVVRPPWRAVLPTKQDIAESIPLMWHPILQSLLPPSSSSILLRQQKKLKRDWASVHAAFPALEYELYLYTWFIVGTRTFYFTPESTPEKALDHDDCLALVPFADAFNHADVGCEVSFSDDGYRISATRRLEKGDEIYISYGDHDNDFLLAEYGFILAENMWDKIDLDELLLPLFSGKQKKLLGEAGYLGKYVLDKDAGCYRTQVALRLLCMPVSSWQFVVVGGLEDGDGYQAAVDRIMQVALEQELARANEKLKQVEELDCGLESQRDVLSRRWAQICQLLTCSLEKLRC